eukprot:gene4058-20234_t
MIIHSIHGASVPLTGNCDILKSTTLVTIETFRSPTQQRRGRLRGLEMAQPLHPPAHVKNEIPILQRGRRMVPKSNKLKMDDMLSLLHDEGNINGKETPLLLEHHNKKFARWPSVF